MNQRRMGGTDLLYIAARRKVDSVYEALYVLGERYKYLAIWDLMIPLSQWLLMLKEQGLRFGTFDSEEENTRSHP